MPENLQRLFPTALDVSPEWHLKVQAVFQKHVDNSVSKTVNIPGEAPVEDVKEIFLKGAKLKLKGVTVFREGSKPGVIKPGIRGVHIKELVRLHACGCQG